MMTDFQSRLKEALLYAESSHHINLHCGKAGQIIKEAARQHLTYLDNLEVRGTGMSECGQSAPEGTHSDATCHRCHGHVGWHEAILVWGDQTSAVVWPDDTDHKPAK